ncbi:MAG TPA: Rieske 2Fe-2S domain-containing protein [Bacteroidia bacterium]|nr:Rieske 2Fe-2S domain-containing protein [Bacteroidia bacterium]
MDRREFIKKSCFSCMALGAGVAISSLSSCATLPIIKTSIEENKTSIALSNFANGINAVLVRPKNMDYDILVVKKSESTYNALFMQCTHNQFALSSNKSQIFCSSHGAEFDFEGNVVKGPAEKKLKTFPTVIKDNLLDILLA